MSHYEAQASSFDLLDDNAGVATAFMDASGQSQFVGTGIPTPEQVQEQIRAAFEKPLSPEFLAWVTGYADVGQRNPYLWKWCRRAVELTTLPCIRPQYCDELCDTKALGVMLDVLMDDVADQSQNQRLLEALLSMPSGRLDPDFSGLAPAQRAYGEFALELWRELLSRAKSYPCFDEFSNLLRFDYLQLCNTMRYSYLLNSNLQLLNLAEHDLYTPHNMHIMICSTWDLTCSPDFDRTELGRLRELVWHAQCMGRIGNLITTWQRELNEGDFTSGVYARAVTRGDLTVQELRQGDRQFIRGAIEAGGHELYFLRRWQQHRQQLLASRPMLRSFDVADYVGGFDRLICLHLGSRGYK